MKTFFKKIIVSILILEAKVVLKKYKPKVVAITGSVGKTSTKDAVYAALSGFFYVRKSEKSYNSEIGLPLTILGVPNGWSSPSEWLKNILKGLWLIIYPHKYPEWLVLEVGVGKPGDMKKTASWLSTDVVIMTAITETPAHIEFFSSRKHLVEEKSGLIKTLKKSGLLILNADDETVLSMKANTKRRVFTYGFSEGSNFLGSGDNILYSNDKEGEEGIPEGIVFRVDEGGSSLPVVIEGVFGRNHIYAALAALALVSHLKLNMMQAIDALRVYDMPPGRMRLLKGIHNTSLIDDTYNSSPFACESALKTLGEVKTSGRKISVLGDMLELGKHTEESHKKIGEMAKAHSDVLVVVGPRARSIKAGALGAGMSESEVYEFLDAKDAGAFLEEFIKKGDTILIKGSQGVRMERVTGMLLADKAHKSKLLVRQDKEWLQKN